MYVRRTVFKIRCTHCGLGIGHKHNKIGIFLMLSGIFCLLGTYVTLVLVYGFSMGLMLIYVPIHVNNSFYLPSSITSA